MQTYVTVNIINIIVRVIATYIANYRLSVGWTGQRNNVPSFAVQP